MIQLHKYAIGLQPIPLPLRKIGCIQRGHIVKPDAWLTPILDGSFLPVLVCDSELILGTCAQNIEVKGVKYKS